VSIDLKENASGSPLTNPEALEKFYREGLEERLIAHLAKVKNYSLEQAMDVYYHSKLAQKIYEGLYDIQYLDYKVLVEILLDTEPELVEDHSADKSVEDVIS